MKSTRGRSATSAPGPPAAPNGDEKTAHHSGMSNEDVARDVAHIKQTVDAIFIWMRDYTGNMLDFAGDEIELWDYFEVLIRRRLIITTITPLIALLVVLGYVWQDSEYTAVSHGSWITSEMPYKQGDESLEPQDFSAGEYDPRMQNAVLRRMLKNPAYTHKDTALVYWYSEDGDLGNAFRALETKVEADLGGKNERGNITVTASHEDSNIAILTANAWLDEFDTEKRVPLNQARERLAREQDALDAEHNRLLIAQDRARGAPNSSDARTVTDKIQFRIENRRSLRDYQQLVVNAYENSLPPDASAIYATPANVSPPRKISFKIAGIGVVLGLFVSMFSAFGWEYARKKFKLTRKKGGDAA